MIALLFGSLALAETATTLDAGRAVVYSGLGLGSFATGSSGLDRDRQWRARVDLYGALGLAHRLQLSLDLPLMHTWVQPLPDRGPCPTASDYCDPVTTVGESGLHARYQVLHQPLDLSAGLGLRSDAWNAGTRDRWTNAGLGVTSLVGSLLAGRGWGRFTATGWAHYALVFGRAVEVPDAPRLPADALVTGLAGQLAWRPATVELAITSFLRLGGVEYEDWVGVYSSTEDRWAALAYRDVAARLKLSLPLGEQSGLHLSAGRVLWADNGPRDALDLSAGLHHSWKR